MSSSRPAGHIPIGVHSTLDRRTRSNYSLGRTGDAAWVSSSPMDNRGARLRLDLESDNEQQRIQVYPSDDDEPSSPSGYLPPPTSARHELKSRRRFSWTFVFRGRRRRLTIPISFASAAERIKGWRLRGNRRRDRRGLVGGFLRDVRDVAVFPLVLFALIAWWMFTDGTW